jgi:glucose-6-phosphate isomerase
MSVLRPKPPEDPLAYDAGQTFAAGVTALLADRGAGLDHDAIPAFGQGACGLPERLLADYNVPGHRAASPLSAILRAAAGVRDVVDRVIVLGADAGVLAARAIFEACAHPLHNALSRGERGGRPRLEFLGPRLDPDLLAGVLDLVAPPGGGRGDDLLDRWGLVVVDREVEAGGTAAAARLFLDALDRGVEGDGAKLAARTVAIGSRDGWLARLAAAGGFACVPPVPEEPPGAAAAFTAIGLLPAAVAGIDVVRLLEGAAALARRCREASVAANPLLHCAAVARLVARAPAPARIMLAADAPHLEGVCRWQDRLVEDSRGGIMGAAPVAGAPSLRLVTRVVVAEPRRDRLVVPPLPRRLAEASGMEPPLDARSFSAAHEGVGASPAILLPRVDEHAVGQLLHLLIAAEGVAAAGNTRVGRPEPGERLL